MGEKDKEYFVPEQLEDNDYEKEKLEDKKRKQEKKLNKNLISDDEEKKIKQLNKKRLVSIIASIIAILLIVFGIYMYLNPEKFQKKASEPEQLAKDVCAYFNSGKWKTLMEKYIDLKGYYILGAVLSESEYTEFDKEYKDFQEDTEEYQSFLERVNVVTAVDDDIINSYGNFQIVLNEIESCNKIQGTDSLYKIRVNFVYAVDGQTETVTSVIFVSNANGEYKMVYGEWLETILNIYQSVYLMQNQYSY